MDRTIDSGALRIYEERERQIKEKGYTAEHDAEHAPIDFIDAARCYAFAATYTYGTGKRVPKWVRDNAAYWPWDEDAWKPSADPARNLEKAGALIAAAIDRLEMER